MPPKPAPIAYFIDTYPNPTHTFIWREIQALEALGWTVHRFTGYPAKPGSDPTQLQEIARSQVLMSGGRASLLTAAARSFFKRPRRFLDALKLARQCGRVSDRGMVVTIGYFLQGCLLRERLARTDAVHLHAHFGANSTEIAMYCHALGGPQYSMTVHGQHEFDRAQTLNFSPKVERAAFVGAISRYCRSQLFRWCRPEDYDKIRVVHCALPPVQVDRPFEPIVPTDRPRLLVVSRLHPEKGHLILLAALRTLRAEGACFELRFAGTGPYEALLRQRVTDWGLSDSVTFLGWKTEAEVSEELRHTTALVQPSFAEGLPVSVMEASAAGRVSVASDVGAVHALVIPNKTGWLVRPGSVRGLTRALRELLQTDAATLDRMGRAAQRRVKKNHDVRVEAGKLAKLIRAAIDRNATAA